MSKLLILVILLCCHNQCVSALYPPCTNMACPAGWPTFGGSSCCYPGSKFISETYANGTKVEGCTIESNCPRPDEIYATVSDCNTGLCKVSRFLIFSSYGSIDRWYPLFKNQSIRLSCGISQSMFTVLTSNITERYILSNLFDRFYLNQSFDAPLSDRDVFFYAYCAIEVRWATSNWTVCNEGIQTRNVSCTYRYNNGMNVVCDHNFMPVSSQKCNSTTLPSNYTTITNTTSYNSTIPYLAGDASVIFVSWFWFAFSIVFGLCCIL